MAENVSPKTEKAYLEAVTQFATFLADRGMPTDVGRIHREHVEAYITYLLERWKPATAHNRYRGLQRFFAWCIDEGDIKHSPMERMKPPRVPESSPPILREDELARLLAACKRSDGFDDRRDYAVLLVFIETGARPLTTRQLLSIVREGETYRVVVMKSE